MMDDTRNENDQVNAMKRAKLIQYRKSRAMRNELEMDAPAEAFNENSKTSSSVSWIIDSITRAKKNNDDSELKLIQAQYDEVKAENTFLQRRVKALEGSKSKLEQSLCDMSGRLAASRGKDKLINQLEEELELSDEQVKTFKLENSKFKLSRHKMKKDLCHQEMKIKKLSSDNRKMQHTKRIEYTANMKIIKKLEKEKDILKCEITNTMKNIGYADRIESLHHQLKETRDAAIMSPKSVLKSELESLASSLINCEHEVSDMHSKLNSIETQITKLSSTSTSSKAAGGVVVRRRSLLVVLMEELNGIATGMNLLGKQKNSKQDELNHNSLNNDSNKTLNSNNINDISDVKNLYLEIISPMKLKVHRLIQYLKQHEVNIPPEEIVIEEGLEDGDTINTTAKESDVAKKKNKFKHL